jgi:uncharacterized repeat protein (TIGR03837 family)
MRTPEHWDIFCRVVDNFGDAGVCWRLARKLTVELGMNVRLWIDEIAVLRKLHPAVTSASSQVVDGVAIIEWNEWAHFESVSDTDVVIEGFGCGLPDAYVEAIAQSRKSVLWIVLEYLSAEPWVREHHGLPSPHPRWPLERYFFFPGFGEGTGGLLREKRLFEARDAFDAVRREAFWASAGQTCPGPDADIVSIFGYEGAPILELLTHWEQSSRKTVAVIPEGALAAAALNHFGLATVPAERVLRRASLEVRLMPWVPQSRYDELLWSCDVNFVRGEDSFVRAQWAARPLVWHIYPQEEGVHAKKLDAFVDLYCEGLASDAAEAVRGLNAAWNRLNGEGVRPGAAWEAWLVHRDALRRHARSWADRIAASGELAENLASFCRAKLK